MNKDDIFRYVRLHRPSTDSYITYPLPSDMTWGEVARFLKIRLPGWELIHATQFNPDTE